MAQLKDLLVLGDCRIEGNVNFDNFNGTINGHSVESDVPSGATFMTTEDKEKLDGIEDNATNTTKQTVSDWGFYEKPTDGIPKTDLSSSVQTSIDGISLKANKSGDTFTGNVLINKSTTQTASQASLLQLGNPTADGTSGASHGCVRLYGKGVNYINLLAHPTTNGNRSVYLPNANNRMCTHISFDTTENNGVAVGDAQSAVYVNSSGAITECTGTLVKQDGYGATIQSKNLSLPVSVIGSSLQVQTIGSTGQREYVKVNALDFVKSSSKYLKHNVNDLSEEEANNILKLRPINFEYINSKEKRTGFIAEEVAKILPNCVSTPQDYDEDNFEYDDSLGFCGNAMRCPSIDYSSFVPYLIKMVQMQQEQINSLEEKLNSLMNE